MINMVDKKVLIYRISLVRSYYTTEEAGYETKIIAETRAYFYSDIAPLDSELPIIKKTLRRILDSLELVLPKNVMGSYEPILYSLVSGRKVASKDEMEGKMFKGIKRRGINEIWQLRITGFEAEKISIEEVYKYLKPLNKTFFSPMPMYEIMRYIAFFRNGRIHGEYDEVDISHLESERPLLRFAYKYTRELSDIIGRWMMVRREIETKTAEYSSLIKKIRGM